MKKIFLTIFMVLCAFVFISNINAYELKIDSNINDMRFLEFYTYVKSSDNSIIEYNKQGKEWARLNATNKGTAYDHYDVIAFLISTAPMSNYNSSGSDKPANQVPVVDENGREREGYKYWSWTTEKNYNVAYVDKYTKEINLENVDNYLNENIADLVRITSKTKQQIIDEKIQTSIISFSNIDIKYKIVEFNGAKLVLYKYEINYDTLMEKLKTEWGEDWVTKYNLEDGGRKYVYISLITKMANTEEMDTAGKFYEEMFSPGKIGSIATIINKYMNTKAKYDYVESQLAIENLPYIARDNYTKIRKEAEDEMQQIRDTYFFGQEPNTTYTYGFLPGVKGINSSTFAYQRGSSAANDYDNRLYLPEEKEKTIYINYLEQNKSTKELSVLYVVENDKKNKPNGNINNPHEISLNGEKTWLSVRDAKIDEQYRNKSTSDENEEYVIPILENKTSTEKNNVFKANYMYLSELEKKTGQKYKYIGLNYLIEKKGTSYEELRNTILENKDSGKNPDVVSLKNSSVKFAVKNTKTVLTSFIYKKAEYDLKVEVQHVVEKSGEILPIAERGNKVVKATKLDTSTDEQTDYAVSYKLDEAYANNLKTGEIEVNGKKYKTNGNLRYEAYMFSTENSIPLVDIKDYDAGSWRNTPYVIYPKKLDEEGFVRVRITFYYESEEEPPEPSPSDEEIPDVCSILKFTSSFSTKYGNCEEDTKGELNNECLESENSNSSNSLYTPTDKEFVAELQTPVYFLNKDYGIKQTIVPTSDYHTITFPTRTVYYDVKPVYNYATDEDGISHRVEPYCERKYIKTDSPNNNAKYKENDDKVKELTKYLESLGSGGRQEIFDGLVTIGSREEYTNTTNSCATEVTTGYMWKIPIYNIELVGFKGYYLKFANLKNYNGDSTRFFGTENYSVLSSENQEFNILDYNFELIKKIKDRFESKGISLECINYSNKSELYSGYGIDLGDDGNEYLYCDTPDEEGRIRHDPTLEIIYDQVEWGIFPIQGDDKFGVDKIEDFNNNVQENKVKTDLLVAESSKYNGERLAIAEILYSNIYFIKSAVGEEVGVLSSSLDKYDACAEGCKGNGKNTGTCINNCMKTNSYIKTNNPDERNIGGSYPNLYYNSTSYITEIDTHTYEKNTNTAGVNILNPAQLDSLKLEAGTTIISQTLGNDPVYNLQIGVESTVIPRLSATDSNYPTLSYRERKQYIGKYIYSFNFPVRYNGIEYQANQPITVNVQKLNENDTVDDTYDESYDLRGKIVFKPIGLNSTVDSSYLTSNVDIRTDEINAVAVTINIPGPTDAEALYKESRIGGTTQYLEIRDICSQNDITNNTPAQTLYNLQYSIRNDSYYLSNLVKLSTTNISRVYDFRITDCTDVNFKSVFRVNSGNAVNKHTGTVYFTGVKELKVYENVCTPRNEKTILPLGPYSQTNNAYVDAPKLGYRISFDLKTSGYYDYTSANSGQSRTIVILPKLYYISKDGKTYIEDVNAYYKNASGKYIKIPQVNKEEVEKKDTYTKQVNGSTYGGYNITYTPNDGYRNVLNLGITDITSLFTTNKRNIDTSCIVLTRDMMCTNYDGFIQSWYGEYKLPNSTILVREGETNLNNYLTDGYIGVVFYIGVVEQTSGKTVVITYNTTNKQTNSKMNTSQWDYEGYIGFNSPGSAIDSPLKIQLARGTWEIYNDVYQKVKGTVILYDIDSRAASDFE